MKNQFILLILFIIMLVNITTADFIETTIDDISFDDTSFDDTSYIRVHEYESGDIISLYTIPQCSGPVIIKIVSDNPIKNNEMRIEKCSLSNDIKSEFVQYWSCSCKQSFNIKILTLDTTSNTYTFSIEYYLKYVQPTVNQPTVNQPTVNQPILKNELLNKSLINESINKINNPSLIEIQNNNQLRSYKISNVIIKPLKESFNLFIFNTEIKQVIYIFVFIFIFIISIIIIIIKKTYGGLMDTNHDVLNYKVTKDDDINEILRHIK